MCGTHTVMGLILYTARQLISIICLLCALPSWTVRSLRTIPSSVPSVWPGIRKALSKYLLSEWRNKRLREATIPSPVKFQQGVLRETSDFVKPFVLLLSIMPGRGSGLNSGHVRKIDNHRRSDSWQTNCVYSWLTIPTGDFGSVTNPLWTFVFLSY